MELSEMCDLDILIVVRDRLLDKVSQYTSGSPDSGPGLFNIDKAYEKIMNDKKLFKNIRTYTDRDYEDLKITAKGGDKDMPDLASHVRPVTIDSGHVTKVSCGQRSPSINGSICGEEERFLATVKRRKTMDTNVIFTDSLFQKPASINLKDVYVHDEADNQSEGSKSVEGPAAKLTPLGRFLS